jgi:hypothetical protein
MPVTLYTNLFLFWITVKSMSESQRKFECSKYKSHIASVMFEIIYCLRYMGYVQHFGWWIFTTVSFLLLLAACILVLTLATNLNIKTNVKTMSV